jgi:hypothetical protein
VQQVGVQFYVWSFLIWEEDWKLLLCARYEDAWIVCWWYRGLLHVHCMLPEDCSCLIDIIYVWFYPPVLHISQLMSLGNNLKFLPHSFPSPVTSYAMPVIILACWTVSFFVWFSLVGFLQFTTKNNSLGKL